MKCRKCGKNISGGTMCVDCACFPNHKKEKYDESFFIKGSASSSVERAAISIFQMMSTFCSPFNLCYISVTEDLLFLINQKVCNKQHISEKFFYEWASREDYEKLEKENEGLRRKLQNEIDRTDRFRIDMGPLNDQLKKENEDLRNQLKKKEQESVRDLKIQLAQEKSHLENMTNARDHFKALAINYRDSYMITGKVDIGDGSTFDLPVNNNIRQIKLENGIRGYIKNGKLAVWSVNKKDWCEHIRNQPCNGYLFEKNGIKVNLGYIVYDPFCQICKKSLGIE